MIIKPHFALKSISVYTKTGLVFGFSKNQILAAVIPGLKSAEDFTRAK
jgi:phosphopantetheine adenylyltransferase